MSDDSTPLCVALDGALTAANTLDESLLARRLSGLLVTLPAWFSNRATPRRRELAKSTFIDLQHLPLREELFCWLRDQRAKGRRLILIAALPHVAADSLATQWEIFDEVIAGEDFVAEGVGSPLSLLLRRYGNKGFDYVGAAGDDVSIWKACRQAFVIGTAKSVEGVRRLTLVTREFRNEAPSLKHWVKAIRMHQWVKNILIFLPALLAHRILEPRIMQECIRGFLAFGLCASSVYVLNDLFDLSSDRFHPRKRRRPFAAGVLSVRAGLAAAALLLVGAGVVATSLNLYFCGVLLGYYLLTWAYSLRLKRIALIDVLVLAALYTIRIIAGAAASVVPLSFWLLAFSVFIFLSLGTVKRFTELDEVRQLGKAGGHGRGYAANDLPFLMNLGISSGYCSVVVTALYINSPDSMLLYRHGKPLWLICPLLLFWISRIWLLTSRGRMHDDPVVFAIRDSVSLAILALIGLVVVIAV